MNVRSIIVIVLALAGGVSAAVAVMRIRPNIAQVPEAVPTTLVVAPKEDIPANAYITEEMLQEVEYPTRHLLPNVCTDAKEVIGKRALMHFAKGEPLIVERTGTGNPSSDIPAGHKAYSITAIEARKSGAGWIHPGDKVDVLVTVDSPGIRNGENTCGVVAHQLEVFAAGSKRSALEHNLGMVGSMSLIVTPGRVQAMSDAEGEKLTLCLRNPYDETEFEYQEMTLDSLSIMKEIERLEQLQATKLSQLEDEFREGIQWELFKEWKSQRFRPPLESMPAELVQGDEPSQPLAEPEPAPEGRVGRMWLLKNSSVSVQSMKKHSPVIRVGSGSQAPTE